MSFSSCYHALVYDGNYDNFFACLIHTKNKFTNDRDFSSDDTYYNDANTTEHRKEELQDNYHHGLE